MSSVSASAPQNDVSNRPRIEAALKRASRATGIDFKYLVDTAVRESNLKTGAKSKASSATGLFQFIDETWLSTLKEFGPKFGLKQYSDIIERTSSGRHKVTDASRYREILALRTDPEISAVMAGAYAGKSAAYLKERLGREPRQGEVYIAHFLGIKGAGELIAAATQRPDVAGSAMFPTAAESNPSIFYQKNGRARSVRDVYYGLVAKHSTNVANYRAESPRLVRIPGQPLKLTNGLIEKMDHPVSTQTAGIAASEYQNSSARVQANRVAPAPQIIANNGKPTPWPVKPETGIERTAQFPVAGPGSLGYLRASQTEADGAQNNGSLVRANQVPFAAFSRVSEVLKAHVERSATDRGTVRAGENSNTSKRAALLRRQAFSNLYSKPVVLDAKPSDGSNVEAATPDKIGAINTSKPGRIFARSGLSFFGLRGKQ